jgi:5,10-methylenetetrahydrofolate reductase
MGVDFLITQLFFDNDYYFNFVERARKAGIQIPIIPALLPILNASQIRRFTTLCGASIPEQLNNKLTKIEDDDDQVIQLGIEYASQQAENLLSNKVPGVHFYVLNKNYSVQKILKNLNLVPH